MLSKVAERIALAQFNNYLTQKNHLTCHQSGNRKHHSTETLSLLVSDHIFSAMVKKQITPVVLIDVNKAFNSLCYPNYRSWALPTKLFYGSKVTLQTDNSSLVLQLHCQNHSLSHMAYLRTQFSAQRFSEELGGGGSLINFLPLKRGWLLEGGGLFERMTYCK